MLPEHFLAHYPGLEKKHYAPHCKQRPSVSHTAPSSLFFSEERSFTSIRLAHHGMERAEVFKNWFSCVYPMCFVPGRVARSLTHTSPARWQKCSFMLLYFLSQAFPSRTVCLPETLSGGHLRGSCAGLGWRSSVPSAGRVCGHKGPQWPSLEDIFGTEFLIALNLFAPGDQVAFLSPLISSRCHLKFLPAFSNKETYPQTTVPPNPGRAHWNASSERSAARPPAVDVLLRRCFPSVVFGCRRAKSLLEDRAPQR